MPGIKQIDHADLPPPESESIPWTIANKYYSADVHFHIVLQRDFTPHSAQGALAVIYVWQRGDVRLSSLPLHDVRLIAPLD